ncbi:Dipeptidyl-peptidase_I [Hexamita inflata]|uniref:Dipeptidyl peptidase 1 n=1 Tax=Hexamita inflata TaxID=28002 RepID=A0AA86QEP8_9EUKA|nr:Dipeptidyl-peptidase I [Hexamita inflata]
MLFLTTLIADTPANCVQDLFLGTWSVHISSEIYKPKGEQVKCPEKFNTSEEFTFTLLERGVAISSQGAVRSGRWSPDANQGFEVRFGGRVFFFFSDYDAQNVSYCRRTSVGYVHDEGLLNQKFRCAYANNTKPTVTETKPLLSAYEDPEGHKLWVGSPLPKDFSLRNINGKSYLPRVFNQQQCGSCYAAASTQAMMSRVMVASNLSSPLGQTEFLSVQHVVDCSIYSQACDGGFGEQVSKFSEDFGVLIDADYSPYTAEVGECKPKNPSGKRYHFTGQNYLGGYFGADNTVESMQWELYRYGAFPVSVYVDTQKDQDGKDFSDFRQCKRRTTFPGVKPVVPNYPELTPQQIIDKDGRHYYLKKSNHLVLLTGWGSDEDGDYWEIMNSWGNEWCDHGFIRIDRGTNAYNVESAPIVFYWAGENVEKPVEKGGLRLSNGWFDTLVALCVIFGVAVIGLGVALVFLLKNKKQYQQVSSMDV